jgi:atypical dual specificity phosphatase
MPERFSWILPKKLAVGSFPNSTDSVRQLQRMGIQSVLSLTEPDEKLIPSELVEHFVWRRVPMPDGYTGGIPNPEHFGEALDILTGWQHQHQPTYVHCLAGIGRSASVCVAYLVDSQGMSLAEAMRFVKQCHPSSSPDQHQVRVMRDFFAARVHSRSR